MPKLAKLSIILLRVAVGWFFLYMGLTAFLNPAWSIVPQIQNPHTFAGFYDLASSPLVAPYASIVVKALFVLIGALLILGIFLKIGSFLGAVMMLFFYFPLLQFPHVVGGYYIVDDHIILALILMFFFSVPAGKYLSLSSMFRSSRY